MFGGGGGGSESTPFDARNANKLTIFRLHMLGFNYIVWSMGTAVCKVVGFLQGVSVTASVITLMVIAVERCQVIRHPLIGGLTRR